MKSTTRQRINLSAAILVIALILGGIVALVYVSVRDLQTQEPTLTESLVSPPDNSPKLECTSGLDHSYTYVRCRSNRYGRMLFIWVAEDGAQHVIGQGNYTRDFGILISVSSEREIIVTFTDMDDERTWTAVEVVSTARDCTVEDGCYRVRA